MPTLRFQLHQRQSNQFDQTRYLNAHLSGYSAGLVGKPVSMDFDSEVEELGFKAGWHMAQRTQQPGGYWDQTDYHEIWNLAKRHRLEGDEYQNQYARGSWQWRAYRAGWTVAELGRG